MDDLDERVDALYAGPPGAFTAARDALSRELRGAGEREAADRVRALRRPTRLADGLNRLARERPDAVAAVIAAQDGLAEAQSDVLAGRGGAEELRAAADDEAAAVAALSGDPTMRAALRAAARSEATRDDLRRGRLSADPDLGGGGGLFATGPAPARAGWRPATRSPAPRRQTSGEGDGGDDDELASARARRERRRALEEARDLARAAEQAERAADAAWSAARSRAGEAEARRAAAARALDDAHRALEQARDADAAATRAADDAAQSEAAARAGAEAAAHAAAEARAARDAADATGPGEGG